jgi:hypothetical protein
MARLAPVSCAALILLAGPALAQTDPRLQVDQLSAPAPVRVETQAPGARPSAAVGQLDTPSRAVAGTAQQLAPAGADTATGQLAPETTSQRVGQLAAPGAATPTAQLSRRNDNPRVAAIPPWMVDACDEAARGRRPPPDAVDCAQVLEAVAAAEPVRSAEESLLASPEEEFRRTQAARASLGLTPNADEIARRLGSGDVQNAPIAQAVGAAFNPQQVQNNETPASGGIPIVIPGRSGPVTVTPSGPR